MERSNFTYEQAIKDSVDYFNGDELAAKVFVDKYALRDNDGNIYENTPEKMHRRIAKEFARIEKNKFKKPLTEEEIFSLLDRFREIVPQGSPMSAIGNNYQLQSLGNCFVIPKTADSYGGICYSDQQLVQLMKRRAGVGICIDNIRPKGLSTKNAAKTTDGISVFMERFSNSCREVAQGGRRGALLIGISIHHPEIEAFINAKRDLKKVTGANISIKISDEFMEAVKKNEDYEQRWPVDSKSPKIKKLVNAKDIWDKIIDGAHATAEPGVLYWNKMQEYGLSDCYKVIDPRFEDIITNPCGEIAMGVDSCRLMVLNLYSFVRNPFSKKSTFDYKNFYEKTKIAQRLMDDLIDLELEAIEKILNKIKADPEEEHIKQIELSTWQNFKETCINGRRTGLGITALGDALAALGIRYGSDESVSITEEIYKTLALASMESSCEMAKELGSFPIWDKKVEKNHPFLELIFNESPAIKELHSKYGRRNISLTTTAPTGSVSICTQTTSGIEPAYLLSYIRRRKVNPDSKNVKIDFVDQNGDQWEENTVYHHHLKTWMDVSGETDINKSPYHKATSNDVDWLKSVEIQSVAQKWISHSISKTCNIPNNSTKELVSEIYMKAWETGCKGFTVYRDGCRTGVLVEKKDDPKNSIIHTSAPKRPKSLKCDVHHISLSEKKYYAVVGLLENDPYEVFVGINQDKEGDPIIPKMIKNGELTKKAKKKYVLTNEESDFSNVINNGHKDENADALGRLISTSLRHGAPISFVVHQLEKTDGNLSSFSKVLCRALKKYIKDGTVIYGESCPTCSSQLTRESGCATCKNCGYSKCQ